MVNSEYYPQKRAILFKHQFFYLFFILFFFFQIEHGTKYPVPDSCTDAKTHIVIFIMMKMVISPKRFHPFKGRVPGMDGIMHGAVHQVTEDKSGEKHKSAFSKQYIL